MPELVANLVETVPGKALDATMGKAVDDRITVVSNSLDNCVFTAEGSGSSTRYYIQSGADAASKKLFGSGFSISNLESGLKNIPTWGETAFSKMTLDTKGTSLLTIKGLKLSLYTNGSRNIVYINGTEYAYNNTSAEDKTFNISGSDTVIIEFNNTPRNYTYQYYMYSGIELS